LANPQNLSIGELVSEPRFSPFATALSHGTHMMVVPTQRGSIYKRVWCVYEAHLASTEHRSCEVQHAFDVAGLAFTGVACCWLLLCWWMADRDRKIFIASSIV